MRLFSTLLLLILSFSASAQKKPRLVVNIVVSQLRAEQLANSMSDFGDEGFLRFMKQGVVYSQSRYEFMQTSIAASLSSFATGVYPSVHGVIGDERLERTTNDIVGLIDDKQVTGLDCNFGIGQYSAGNLTFSTVGDMLKKKNPKSKVVSLAIDPLSSIILGGALSTTYWLDLGRGTWVSSSAFLKELPLWVSDYNKEKHSAAFLSLSSDRPSKRMRVPDFLAIPFCQAGNAIITDFAKRAVIYEFLGSDENTDILNVCYDAPRYIASRYGADSKEYRAMLVELDKEIEDLVNYTSIQRAEQEVLFVLSAAQGTSPTYRQEDTNAGLFEAEKYKILANAFLSSQYGEGQWVINYKDRQIYLNHNLVYANKLVLSEVQNRLVNFTLQFRGVSHVFTSETLQHNYFAGGFARLAQNSFYPKYSGDLVLNFLPGWIEQKENTISSSGSLYDYDRHVPLMFLGAGLEAKQIDEKVDMCSVASTLSYILGIENSLGIEADKLQVITDNFK